MGLIINLDNHATEFGFTWEALRSNSNGKPCYLWEYHTAGKEDKDMPVIYRHVLETPSVGIVTIYVGQGRSLNGPNEGNHLQSQYSGRRGGSRGREGSRVKVRKYLAGRSEIGWTEILSSQLG